MYGPPGVLIDAFKALRQCCCLTRCVCAFVCVRLEEIGRHAFKVQEKCCDDAYMVLESFTDGHHNSMASYVVKWSK